MARNSDMVSRNSQRSETALSGSRATRVGVTNRTPEYRVRGRRGVRARRRAYRIAERQANGTYRQPTGGTITNS